MKYLNITNLETVVWIARLGSFTAAAERLHTTQPAISTRVRDLESSLGIKLFSRAVRGVELTLEGRAFVEKVQPLLQHLQELSASLQEGAVRGMVRVGAGNICMSWFPDMVADLRTALPHLTYDVELDLGNRLLQRLESRKLDLAIVSGPVSADKFESRSLGFDRMSWIVSAALLSQGVAGDASAMMRRLPLWCVQRESFYWNEAVAALGDDGPPPHLNAIDNMAGAAQIVRKGGGAALLSETLVQQELADGTMVRLPSVGSGQPVEFSIAWSKGERHPVLAQVVDAAVRASTFSRQAP